MKKNNDRIKRWLNCSFIVLIIVFLVINAVRAIGYPKDMNYYENRYSEKIAPFSLSSYLDTSYQDQFENGMMDQVIFSQRYKKAYNTISSYYLQQVMKPILKKNPERYISYMGKQIFGGDYITYYIRQLEDMTSQLDEKIDNYNSYYEKMPELDFYLYYIEKDTDINFETNKKTGVYEYMQERLLFPKTQTSKFKIDNFEEFSSYFYKTDHHWNYKGAYLAYTEILELLGVTDSVMLPQGTEEISYTFSGSKAAGTGAAAFREHFVAYRFEYPDMKIQIDGEEVADYGNQDAYFEHEMSDISYGKFYGGDDGEIIFDLEQPEKENILLIGESYDNAILKLVASHFNRTYSVDLRNYESELGKEFSFMEYVREHDISKVLLIGNVDYFVMDKFMLED